MGRWASGGARGTGGAAPSDVGGQQCHSGLVDQRPAVQLQVAEGAQHGLQGQAGLVVGLQATQELEEPEVPMGEGAALGTAPLRGDDRGQTGDRARVPAEVALCRAVQVVDLLREEVVLRRGAEGVPQSDYILAAVVGEGGSPGLSHRRPCGHLEGQLAAGS